MPSAQSGNRPRLESREMTYLLQTEKQEIPENPHAAGAPAPAGNTLLDGNTVLCKTVSRPLRLAAFEL